ncbi:DUF1949 domain-containing protein [Catenovulum sediminis]|uniref:DUF1949 domain-containing protein n=1 Tax=Catenovulum sediminis TaxID=1740262 RepID=UPI00117EDF27|nr:DUF1949 domain-containing protein [Catenovulum sediminis]
MVLFIVKVGKRILCANRYGKSGCGRTLALYLSDFIPNRRYSFSVIWAFVLSLLQGATVEQAYYSAIGHCHFSHRQAYRWLSALYAQLGLFRSWLARLNLNLLDTGYLNFRSTRLAVLLSTLASFAQRFTNISSIQAGLNCRFC